MEKEMNFLDRNEFNFDPSEKVVEAIRNFDPKTLCFYTRIYDQGKKSVVSVKLSEIYGVPDEQVLRLSWVDDQNPDAEVIFEQIEAE
jgi:histidinol-phosphate aminotransferase